MGATNEESPHSFRYAGFRAFVLPVSVYFAATFALATIGIDLPRHSGMPFRYQ
jgi:hypothetical protein